MEIMYQTIILWKLNKMANQHYTIIEEPQMLIDDYLYVCETWNMNLKEFLVKNAGKEIYIYGPSIVTDKIRGIVK